MAQTTLDKRMLGSQSVSTDFPAVADLTDTTIAASDILRFGDTSDSNATKKDTVQGLLDLAGGGAWDFISKTNVAHDNSGDIEITGLTAYHTYKIFLWSVSNSDTSGTTEMQTSNDGGSSWNTSNYRYSMIYSHTNSTTISNESSNGTAGWVLFPSGTETGDFPQSSEITLFRGRYDDANRTDNRTHMIHHGFRTSNAGGYGYQFHTAGWQTTGSESNAANAIKFMKNGGGSLQHGHIIVLGLKES